MSEVTVRNYPISSTEILEACDLNIDCRVKGFCDKTMTLLFKENPCFNPELLPTNTIAENATTETAVCSSLACKMHDNPVSYITTESLHKLYHIIDNPTVSYDPITKVYDEPRMFYIDRETMTGIIVGHTVANSHYHPVHGIFAPRGYGKIECYNNFNELYLTERLVVEQEFTEYLGVGNE